ncbi:hypothetical protein LLG39_15830 [bacterium]|nr:hypothetical protein [bacterium]
MPNQTTKTYTNRTEYLAGYPGRTGTITLDEDLFARAADGTCVLQPGTLLSKPSNSDLWGPYDSTAEDGRQTATNNVLILHDYTVLDDGVTEQDKEVAVLLEGLALGSKVILEDGTAVTSALKDALRSQICDVQFAIE